MMIENENQDSRIDDVQGTGEGMGAVAITFGVDQRAPIVQTRSTATFIASSINVHRKDTRLKTTNHTAPNYRTYKSVVGNWHPAVPYFSEHIVCIDTQQGQCKRLCQ